jgi:hypothetical protein
MNLIESQLKFYPLSPLNLSLSETVYWKKELLLTSLEISSTYREMLELSLQLILATSKELFFQRAFNCFLDLLP